MDPLMEQMLRMESDQHRESYIAAITLVAQVVWNRHERTTQIPQSTDRNTRDVVDG
jgi:hypothetical protein